MNLTKAQEKKLRENILHITGECMCLPTSSCAYWKGVDKDGAWQTDSIIKLVKQL